MTVMDAPPKAANDNGNSRNLPTLAPPRLPYHPAIEERFGIDKSSWKALVEAIFPNASTPESVILALSYCRARKLDPFKRNVHIVPIWDKNRRCMVDTIWPGIGELRTTAFRTGEYAGRDHAVFGPDVTKRVGSLEITFPEWAQVSVYRVVQGNRVSFAGPRVYWLESYATVKRDDDTPNEMWAGRPRGQLEKCAEAAALRAGFPEEIGNDYIADEAEGFNGRIGVPRTTVSGETPRRGAAALNETLSARQAVAKQLPDTQLPEDEAARRIADQEQSSEGSPQDDFPGQQPSTSTEAEQQDQQQPEPPPQQQGDPKAEWERFLNECRGAAQDTGLSESRLLAGVGKTCLKLGIKGKEERMPAKERADMLAAIKAGQGHFAVPDKT